jgi:hypothetical protein
MPQRHTPLEEPAHDVLAAEEFGVPAPDPSLRHAPVTLPADPTGIAEPHDVLAAEEFAIPSYKSAGSLSAVRGRRDAVWARDVAVGALAFAVLWRLWRKRWR